MAGVREDTKNGWVHQALLAFQEENYLEMAAAMKNATETGAMLSEDERYFLSLSYKIIVSDKRSSWGMLRLIAQASKGLGPKQQLAHKYRQKLENEIRQMCLEVLGLVDNFLLPNSMDAESRVFFLKMKGDYSRYLAEITSGKERDAFIAESGYAYDESFELSRAELAPTCPLRVEVALNFTVLLKDLLKCPERALPIAQQALDEAMAQRGTVPENAFNSIRETLLTLHENLERWGALPEYAVEQDCFNEEAGAAGGLRS